MIGLIIILLFGIVTVSVILRKQLIKVAKYEQIVIDQVGYLNNISKKIRESREYLNDLDEREVFRSDDEIGFFFSQLLKIQEELDRYTLPSNYGKEE